MTNLNNSIINDLPIQILSRQEQTQIVQEIESRLSVTDNLEFVIRNSIEKAEALRQSILKKAFEGKLLSEAEIAQCKQEADYEPASELLKKIKAEKVKTQGFESQQKKSTTKKKGKE
jgi:type I restriction enzyme, S subunit